MKYLIAVCVTLVAAKAVMNTPELLSMLTNNKEVILALGLTLLARPMIKRVFG